MKLILQLFAPVALVGTAVVLGAQAPQSPPPNQGAGGRGGGIGAVAAALFTEKCAGCHGTDLAGGRAASLFDQKVLARLDDDRLARIIRAGLPAAGMPAFDDLTDEQVGQLIHHIRAETGNLAPKPAFIAESGRAHSEDREADGESGARRRRPRNTVGVGVSARRTAAGDRTFGQPSDCRQGHAVRTGEGHAESARAAGRRNARRRSASELREERLDLSRVFGGAARLHAAGARSSAAGSRHAAGSRPRSADSFDDGHRPRQARQEQSNGATSSCSTARHRSSTRHRAHISACGSCSIARGTSFIPSASAVSCRTHRTCRTRSARSIA